MLTIAIPSWYVFPFINKKWPSFSLLTNFVLRSIFIRCYSYSKWFQGPFALKIFSPLLFYGNVYLCQRNVSCNQQVVRSCFLIQLTILSLLIGQLRPLTFSVSIERYVTFPAFCFCFSDVYFSPISCLIIYLASGVYSFLHFPGCIYLLHL
jgi:hypothetical protein